jgi:2'-5' RNA ligase
MEQNEQLPNGEQAGQEGNNEFKPKQYSNQREGGYGGNRGGYRGGNDRGGYRGGRSQGKYGRKPLTDAEKKMYYIALLCPLAIDEQIDVYKQAVKTNFGCEVAAKSPAHITLITPFFLSDAKYADLVQKLENFDCIITDVDIAVEGFNFFGKRVIFADVQVSDNLTALQEQVENYLKNSGFPFIREAKKPFHPHVTIATRDLKEEDFDAAWSMFDGKSFSASFSTNAIHLMKMVDDKWIHDKEFILK